MVEEKSIRTPPKKKLATGIQLFLEVLCLEGAILSCSSCSLAMSFSFSLSAFFTA
jgi:hypothetical protein